jgi:predicted MFS family arabinose efflux permease
VPLAERQIAISRFIAFGIAGQMAGGVMAGLLEPVIGWRALMALCGLLSLLAVLPLLRDRVPDLRGRLSVTEAMARYRFLLTHKPALVLYWAVGIEGMLIFGAFPYFANHLLERGMGATREAGLTVAAFACGGFFYAACAPMLVAKLGPRRMMRFGGAIAALGLAALGLAPSGTAFIGAGLFVGVGFFMLHNSLQVRVTEVAPQARASAVSLHAFHFFMGQAMGPPLMGAIRWAFGLEAGLLLAACGLLALGLFMGRRRETA